MYMIRFVRVFVITIMSLLAIAPVAAQEGLDVEVAIEQVTFNPKTKDVTVTGTVTCSEPVDWTDVFVTVSQTVGRGQIASGLAYFTLWECVEGETFTVTITGYHEDEFFRPGDARVSLDAFGCSGSECDFDEEIKIVRLRPGR